MPCASPRRPERRGELTVTASAGGLTAHAAVSVLPYGHWPSGTIATASSYHAPNTVNGQVRTYVPGNAIDGDVSTFWNDANPATYPAVLTVTSPAAVTLTGMAFGSSADGVPEDFTVSTWNGSAWTPPGRTGFKRIVRILVPAPGVLRQRPERCLRRA